MEQEKTSYSKEAQTFLKDILHYMQIEGTVDILEEDEAQFVLHIDSPDAGRLIGRRAQMLESLQILTNRCLIHRYGSSPRCVVDVEHYRDRHREQLIERACEAADKVEKEGKPYRFRPMNAYDRRIIHKALEERSGIETFSEEGKEQGQKSVVVQASGNK